MPKGHFEGRAFDASEALEVLNRFTVNTSLFQYDADRERAEGLLGNAGSASERGVLVGYHVTDDPSKVVRVLEAGGDLWTEEFWGDLCPGLYISATPDYWKSRSSRKWDFLRDLDKSHEIAIQERILDELGRQKRTHYITESEHDMGVRAVEMWNQSGFWEGILRVAGQPYNINIQEIAKAIGLSPFEPHVIPVELKGRFLRMMEREVYDAIGDLIELETGKTRPTNEQVCVVLKENGWDGAFQTSGFSTVSQLVVWNPGAVVRFGPYHRGKASLGASRGEGPTYITGIRFEGSVGEVPTMAFFTDREKKGKRPTLGPMRKGAVSELAQLLEGFMLGYGSYGFQRSRFQGDLLSDGVEIMDKAAGSRFIRMSDDDVSELYALAKDVEARMVEE